MLREIRWKDQESKKKTFLWLKETVGALQGTKRKPFNEAEGKRLVDPIRELVQKKKKNPTKKGGQPIRGKKKVSSVTRQGLIRGIRRKKKHQKGGGPEVLHLGEGEKKEPYFVPGAAIARLD